MKRLLPILLLLLASCGLNGNYRDTSIPMVSVPEVDLTRYQGLWYEIARFPNRFEEGCEGVTAEYGLMDNGRISVTNTCRQGAPDGPVEVAEGSARVAAPGQLKVKFVSWLPFEGDYWVIGLNEAYTVAVIGTPSGDFGWVLGRTKALSVEDQAFAEAALTKAGYDLGQLYYPQHAP